MIFTTHILGGILSVLYFSGGNASPSQMAVAAFFSLLPDVDTAKSVLGRHIQPFSLMTALFFRHRGFLHTVPAAFLVYMLTGYLLPTVAMAALLAYSSHLVLDALTKKGVTLFAPFSKFKIRGMFVTGKLAERALAAVMAGAIIVKLL